MNFSELIGLKNTSFKLGTKSVKVKFLTRNIFVDSKTKKSLIGVQKEIIINGTKNQATFLFKSKNFTLDSLVGIGAITKLGKLIYTDVSKLTLEQKEMILIGSIKRFSRNKKELLNEGLGDWFNKLADIGKKLGYIFDGLFTIVKGPLFILAIISMLFNLKKQFRMKIAELKAVTLEKKLLEKEYKNSPSLSMLQEYSMLISGIKTILSSKRKNGLLIYGPPGTGKTYTTKLILKKLKVPFVYLRGAASPKKLIPNLLKVLAENPKSVIVLDDFDDFLTSQAAVNILKGAVDTSESRIITAPSSDYSYGAMDIPEKFIFEGKIIIITNLEKDELDKAILSRMIGIQVNFTNKQMLDLFQKFIKSISPDVSTRIKQEVLNYLISIAPKHPKVRLDFRIFLTAIELRLLYDHNWREEVTSAWS